MKPPLEQLMQQYQHHLYAAAFNVCKNAQDAEDAVQETLLAYWAHSRDFETEQHLRAWLFRVVINKAKNKCGSFFRRNARPLADYENYENSENYAESLTFETEEAADLFDAVMHLPEKYRPVIHLFYYEDYAVNEIAEILKITPGNVRVRLNRGRNLLRNTLKEAWQDEDE